MFRKQISLQIAPPEPQHVRMVGTRMRSFRAKPVKKLRRLVTTIRTRTDSTDPRGTRGEVEELHSSCEATVQANSRSEGPYSWRPGNRRVSQNPPGFSYFRPGGRSRGGVGGGSPSPIQVVWKEGSVRRNLFRRTRPDWHTTCTYRIEQAEQVGVDWGMRNESRRSGDLFGLFHTHFTQRFGLLWSDFR